MKINDKESVLPRLLADRMLGKLVKYLRIAGFDTAYIKPEKNPVEEARKSKRVLLTRNRTAAARCRALGLEYIFLKDNYPCNQTKEVVEKIRLKDRPRPFTRCVFCNAILSKVDHKEKVEGWVPPFVYETQKEFKRCPTCNRVFWNATHKRSMERLLESIFEK